MPVAMQRQQGFGPAAVILSGRVQSVASHQFRVLSGFPGEVRDIQVRDQPLFRNGFIDCVIRINLPADLFPVAAGGKWRYAPCRG